MENGGGKWPLGHGYLARGNCVINEKRRGARADRPGSSLSCYLSEEERGITRYLKHAQEG